MNVVQIKDNQDSRDYIQVIRCKDCASYHASCPLHSMEDNGYCYKATEYKNIKEKA